MGLRIDNHANINAYEPLYGPLICRSFYHILGSFYHFWGWGMLVRELYNQLTHDLQAHGELEFMVQIKRPDGKITNCVYVADRYVSPASEGPQRYVLRMVPMQAWSERGAAG